MPDTVFDVFLAHNSKDKPAVVELAERLKARGLKVWLDIWELPPGRPWQEALEKIIETARAAAVLVGKDGIGPWEDAEMRACLDEFARRKLPIIPVLLPDCPLQPNLPLLLRRFTWVDLRGEGYDGDGFLRLVWGITGKKPPELSAFHQHVEPERVAVLPMTGSNSPPIARPSISRRVEKTLGTAIEKAISIGLNILNAPFYRPFQYIGMSVAEAARATGRTPNSVGNIIIDSDLAHMLLEAEGNFISYVDIELKQTAPCSLPRSFDSEPVLGALSINPSELDFVHSKTHFHTYYDHKRKLKVSVSCQYEGAKLSVGFSSEWYGM